MNSKFLFSIGLILVALIGFGCVSAADAHNTTMSDNPSVTVEQQQNVNMIQNQNEVINTEKAAKEDNKTGRIVVICSPNNKIEQDSNVTTQTNDTINKTSTNTTKPTLDIRGPKINNTLNIKGPKGPVHIEPSQKTKDIFRIAKHFSENSWINLRHSVIDAYELTAGSHYTLWEIAEIAARAHNIALHKHPDYCWGYGEVTVNQAFEIIKHETWYYFKPRE